MENCIICREKTNDFSDEHVIPDSLGGYYHIYTVCKQCNSDLGSNVDSDLVNHKFSDFQRFLLGIKGKSGKIPNPFSGTHSFTNNSDQKVQVRLDEDKKTVPYIIPSVNQNKSNGLVDSVNIVVDATDEHKLDDIIKKTAKRIGVPYERISVGEKTVQSTPCPEINISLSIDLHDFKLGLLKIAYEFAIDSIPKYYDDPMAIDISKILHSANHERSTDFVKIGNGFQHEVMQPFESLLDFESEKHYLILTKLNENLVCFVKLHKLFTVGVVLSEYGYLDENFIVGINDIVGKSFNKIDAFELIEKTHSKPELRFQYWFKDQGEVDKFLNLQKDPNFGFYMEMDEVPFFKKDGHYAGKTVHQKISELVESASTESLECGGISTSIELDEELYIKITPSNELLCVVSVQEERKQLCKL
ncbi:HNH endonuclease [Aeromonas hydrophila]|uniref:HNH endonuclease n=1 Tax=Aeromonas hydrophila TaxID=644 RepID=UPI001C5BAA64|nr:HNH endonuclease [Aeromonas hydrophila]MBW3832034.1 hypothetical protein [Aeromonas hydrophila]MBW5264025.1 hypothetical protein [Aeromonas hydrophila]MBW5276646.1 hypothetical protein [Aeromonas hydrophila]